MQSITHFFSGVFLMALIQALVPATWLQYVLLFPCGILMHFLVDGPVEITYHPRTPRMQDPFWKGWHLIVIVGSIVVAIVFWVPYFWGMFACIVVDIVDWGILRPICALRKVQLPEDPAFFPRYFIHYWIWRFRMKVFPFLPDWKEKHRGIVPEILIWVACTLGVILFL
jgi:hypothetical protein